jgi:hypothetical protein
MRRVKTLALGIALGLAFTVSAISRAQGTSTQAVDKDQPAACCSQGASCCAGGGGSCCTHGACHMRAAR